MTSLADIFSGGSDKEAQDTLNAQLAQLNALPTPTAAQLTLPQLQQYVVAGLLTPEQAQAYIANGNAYTGVTADNTGMQTELSTIGELQNIINQGGNDAQEQADVQTVLNNMNTTEAGNNAAILNQAAARGLGTSGLVQAAELAGNQNQATSANANALTAAANAEQRQLTAINNAGTEGAAVQGQEYTNAANTANAQNAINEFNAQQNQSTSQFNTTAANAAKAANLANAQDVANKNTLTAQTQEESIPAAQEQAFQNALAKATAGTTAASNAANAELQTGQQNAGILGGLISTAGTVGASALAGNPYTQLASALASNNVTPNTNVATTTESATPAVATGGEITDSGVERPMNMKMGGPVPGMAKVAGDSPINDTVHAKLSPGEIVLPRSVTQPAPEPSKVLNFLRSLPKPQTKSTIHPKAVLDTLRGLDAHYNGGQI